jgi:hypothetical protein
MQLLFFYAEMQKGGGLLADQILKQEILILIEKEFDNGILSGVWLSVRVYKRSNNVHQL